MKILEDHGTMYYQLAAKVADAVEWLTSAQQQGEKQFIETHDDSELVLLKRQYVNSADTDEN